MNSNLKFFLGGIFVGGLAGAIVCYLQHRNHQIEIYELRSDIEYLDQSRKDKISEICKLKKETDETKAELIETQCAIDTFTSDLEGDIPGCIKDLVDARMVTWRGHRDGKSEEEIFGDIKDLRAPTPKPKWLVERSDGEVVALDAEEIVAMRDLAEDLGYGESTELTDAQDYELDERAGDPAINGDLKCEEVQSYSDNPYPYLISEQEFIGSQYDQVSFTYYAADDTLMEDKDQEPVDQDNLGVTELLLEFTRTDEPAIYIRDDTKMLDYEIIWEDGSFQAIVMGMNPESLLLLPRIFREG